MIPVLAKPKPQYSLNCLRLDPEAGLRSPAAHAPLEARPLPAYVRGPAGQRRGGACESLVVAAVMAVMSGSVRLQRCMVSPAGRHSASLIFLHGSGGLQFSVPVTAAWETPPPRSVPPVLP
ncbi:hypothetical protein J1605_015553 [Eschrichtius robustus]|uniref:Uncharacterized protein n=1 Tax=Eschrichtius robustus TaxID=9764 RepID=A0AB34GB82_ESCRO|nr:hypothetical protein J1605_015553 [Eschrichtius robustus]